MTRILREIRCGERTAGKTFTCVKCGEPIYEGDRYQRRIVERTLPRPDPFSGKFSHVVTERTHLTNKCPPRRMDASELRGRSPTIVIMDDISVIDEKIYETLSKKTELRDELLNRMEFRQTDYHKGDFFEQFYGGSLGGSMDDSQADALKYGGTVTGRMSVPGSPPEEKLIREKVLGWYRNVLRDRSTPKMDEKA